MNTDQSSIGDRDLLARLNALKKSSIDLAEKTSPTSHAPPAEPVIDPLPARSLHADIHDRFKTLSGNTRTATDAATVHNSESVEKSEDDKTIEELLADLGSAEHWNVGKSEHDQVEELLRSADVVMARGPSLERIPNEENNTTKPAPAALPAVDISIFQPEPESDEEETQPENKAAIRDAINTEADAVLRRLLDEVELEKSEGQEEDAGNADDENPPPSEERPSGNTQDIEGSAFNLPSTPSKLPDPVQAEHRDDEDEDALAARFASLSLPSASTTFKPKPRTYGKPEQGFTEEEIGSWCIICNDDATLSCIGCDGDLYCTNCWLEGHRGEDAGFEEKTHKAVQYVKGKKKRKAPQKKVAMGV